MTKTWNHILDLIATLEATKIVKKIISLSLSSSSHRASTPWPIFIFCFLYPILQLFTEELSFLFPFHFQVCLIFLCICSIVSLLLELIPITTNPIPHFCCGRFKFYVLVCWNCLYTGLVLLQSSFLFTHWSVFLGDLFTLLFQFVTEKISCICVILVPVYFLFIWSNSGIWFGLFSIFNVV